MNLDLPRKHEHGTIVFSQDLNTSLDMLDECRCLSRLEALDEPLGLVPPLFWAAEPNSMAAYYDEMVRGRHCE